MMQYFRFQLSLLLTFSCFQINAQKYLKAVVCLKDSSYKEVVIEFSKSIFDTLICKDSTNNSFFTPSNILSFTTGTRNFIAIHPQKNLDNLPAKSFFVEQLVDGKAQLYSYSGKYFGQNELYLFRKKGEKQLYAVNKKIKNERIIQFVSSQDNAILGGGLILNTFAFNDEKPFLRYFESYFSDCNLITNKLKQNYYDAQNLKEIFTDYNNCK